MNQSVYDWVGNIPPEMQAVNHFMNCGRDKVPCDGETGVYLGKDDPSNFKTFGNARYFTDADEGFDKLLGFCPRPDDPFVIIDLDYKNDAELSEVDRANRDALYEWAIKNTYVEESLSGRGCHIVIKGTLPRDINKGTKRGIEAYANRGFVLMTGKRISQVQGVIDSPETCEWLFSVYGTKDADKVAADSDVDWFSPANGEELADYQRLLDWLRTFENSAKIERWFSGIDFKDPSYNRRSEDDMALMQLFYKFNKGRPDRDRATIRMFIHSPRAQYLNRKSNPIHYLLNETLPKVKSFIAKEENFSQSMHDMAQSSYDSAMAALEQKAAHEAQQILSTYTGVPNAGIAPVVAPAIENPFKFFTASELKARPPIQWAVDDLLPMGGLAAIYGESGAGKSFVAIDLIAALAEGQKWFGIDTRKLPVACLALEGAGGLKQRVAGWENEKGREFSEEVLFYDGVFGLRDSQQVGQFCAALNNGHGTFDGVIVIDTMNQASGGADENSSRDMGELLAGMREIRRLTNSLVIVVHHATKSKENQSMRGHSSFYAACDAVIEVAKVDGPLREWVAVKVKDARDGITKQFNLEEQQLGFDDKKVLTSLAVKPIEAIVNPQTGEVIEPERVPRADPKARSKGANGTNSRQAPDTRASDRSKPTYSAEEHASGSVPLSGSQDEQQSLNRLDFTKAIPAAFSIIENAPDMQNMKGKNGAPADRCAITRDRLTLKIIDCLNSDFDPKDRKFKKKIIDALADWTRSGRIAKSTENGVTFFWRVG